MTLKETMDEFSVSIMGQWQLSEKRYQELLKQAQAMREALCDLAVWGCTPTETAMGRRAEVALEQFNDFLAKSEGDK